MLCGCSEVLLFSCSPVLSAMRSVRFFLAVATTGGDGGVNIGCGALMVPTTFFTGLIDDARIYNRVVKP